MQKEIKKVFMFDVESDGLYGPEFSVAAILAEIYSDGTVREIETMLAMSTEVEITSDWVKEHVIPSISKALDRGEIEVFKTNIEMRNSFYEFYKKARREGAEIWSDCNYPVETSFMSRVIKDGNGSRDFEGPYPFNDLSGILDININRAKYSKMAYDHNPLNDARASLFSLAKAITTDSSPKIKPMNEEDMSFGQSPHP